ncbi:MAG: hypothetical protein V1874_05070 [Spirochaetota bacterium]
MLKKLSVKYLVLFFMMSVSMAGCSSAGNLYYSIFKKGDIIEMNEKEIVFCVGCVEKIEIGQEFKIYKHVVHKPHYGAYWKKEYIGVVKIKEFTDTHHARATILSGVPDEKTKVEM